MEESTYEKQELALFQKEIDLELHQILEYWKIYAKDDFHGGFIGRVDNYNNQIPKSSKGIILNTRILWTFSRACNFYKDSRYDEECQRAFDYLIANFKDYKYGGVFWELDHLGNVLEDRKQVYAQAFCIYALTEYYKYSKNPKALLWSLELFRLIEDNAYDTINGGYIEAFDYMWKPIADMRLSEKDLNAPKTTNTHLHLLEAYTTLFEITGDADVEKSLGKLLLLFHGRIFEHNNHLKLFFTEDWKSLSTEISYGHDIEAVWLMLHAANILQNKEYIKRTQQLLVSAAHTFVNEALDKEFGVINSKDTNTLKVDTDRHWWPQAEAMVGLMYAWKTADDISFLKISKEIWAFIDDQIVDKEHGEWFFRISDTGEPYLTENKIGPWKCPYHNCRALIEISQLLQHN